MIISTINRIKANQIVERNCYTYVVLCTVVNVNIVYLL